MFSQPPSSAANAAAPRTAVARRSREWSKTCNMLESPSDAAGLAQRRAHGLVVLNGKRGQRQSQLTAGQAHFRQCPLHGNRIGLDEQLALQGQQAIIRRPRAAETARERG